LVKAAYPERKKKKKAPGGGTKNASFESGDAVSVVSEHEEDTSGNIVTTRMMVRVWRDVPIVAPFVSGSSLDSLRN